MNSICSNNFQAQFKKAVAISKQQSSVLITGFLTLSILSPILPITASLAEQKNQVQVLPTQNSNTSKVQIVNLNDVVSTLVGILKDKNIEARVNAIRALGGMGNQAQTAVPDLVIALKDKKPRVRYSAAIALANIGSEFKGAQFKTTLPFIIAALNHESQLLRSDAASALTNIGHKFKQKASKLSKSDLEQIITNFDKALEALEKFQSNFSRTTIQSVRSSRDALQQERNRR
ncbi:HEAT repeat domain-containing protein [Mastigocoleus testarum]|uniref:PBS lyase n=1 Tax=Mastigocoleus testarum BC008 TaxID=371196 RepID=A0A0V7ZRL5_9CYAN|nr:HEAT repeat domain-containing protein [Mastigocoleus testarum]KST67245.1 hypothetical protein BC008_29065 [Mastigocoleus testarum BC008]